MRLERHLTTPNRPVKASCESFKIGKITTREVRGEGNGNDHKGLRERSIYNNCRFDIERPRSRPALSVYTLATHRFVNSVPFTGDNTLAN